MKRIYLWGDLSQHLVLKPKRTLRVSDDVLSMPKAVKNPGWYNISSLSLTFLDFYFYSKNGFPQNKKEYHCCRDFNWGLELCFLHCIISEIILLSKWGQSIVKYCKVLQSIANCNSNILLEAKSWLQSQGLLSLTVVVGALRFDNGGRWDSEKLTRLKNFFLQNFAKINQITFLNPQMVFQASKINVSWLCLERWHGSGYS